MYIWIFVLYYVLVFYIDGCRKFVFFYENKIRGLEVKGKDVEGNNKIFDGRCDWWNIVYYNSLLCVLCKVEFIVCILWCGVCFWYCYLCGGL